MPIDDITTPNSPGWWMNRLALRLQQDRRRFDLLEDHYAGRPPLPWGSEDVKSKFYRFQQVSRTNFAAMLVQARFDRIGIRAVRTAAGGLSTENDDVAWRLVTGNDLDIHFPEAARMALKFGRAYLATGAPEDTGLASDNGLAPITAEDPRVMIAEVDPMNPRRVLAAFKLFHDDARNLDVAILWLPGKKYVAVRDRTMPIRQRRSGGLLGIMEPLRVSFTPSAFDLRPERPEDPAETVMPDGYYSESYDSQDVPVRIVGADDGVGVFELHIDLLDRINHLSFMLLVITTMQAFRQRAATVDGTQPLPQYDSAGNEIDYASLFESGPDAMWLLPPGVKMWESQQVDLNGILQAIKFDMLKLSAVTMTPMSMFTPDAATQTAEGAELMSEGLVAGVEMFLRAAGRSLAAIMALSFSYMGDTERSDPSRIEIDFLPVKRYSLSEKGAATAQVSTVLPFEDILDQVWQMTPEQIAQARSHRAADQAQMAVAAALGAPRPPAAPPVAPVAPAPPPVADQGQSGDGSVL